MGEIRMQVDLMERFYKLKLRECLTTIEALERVKRKFSPTDFQLLQLAERIQGQREADHGN